MKLSTLVTIAMSSLLLATSVQDRVSAQNTEDSYFTKIGIFVKYGRPVTITKSVAGSASAKSGGCSKVLSYSNFNLSDKVLATCGSVRGFASSSVNANLVGNTLSGTLQVSGQLRLPATTTGSAFAGSSAKIVTRAKNVLRQSSIDLSFDPFQITQLLGENRLRSSFAAIDEKTGEILTRGTLFDIQSDYEGSIGWKNGALDLSGMESGIFKINIGNQFTNVRGNLLVEYKDGIMTRSRDTGVFAGLLSPVDSSGGLRLGNSPWAGDRKIDLSFKLPSFATSVTVPHTIQLIGGPISLKRDVAVPEPITIWGSLAGFSMIMSWRRKSFKLAKKK